MTAFDLLVLSIVLAWMTWSFLFALDEVGRGYPTIFLGVWAFVCAIASVACFAVALAVRFQP